MQVSHTLPSMSVSFDDPNLIGAAGLVPVMALAREAGLAELVDQWVKMPTDKGSNAGLKLSALVGGMVAGADSIDDMDILRHGAMKKLFTGCYAPSTLGSYLRSFTFGHVRQLQTASTRFLENLGHKVPLLGTVKSEDFVFIDIDDTIIEVHGYKKQGAGFGYSGVRGLNALLGIVSCAGHAPVIVAQRLRKGSASSARGAASFVAESLRTGRKLTSTGRFLLRADSRLLQPIRGGRRPGPRRRHVGDGPHELLDQEGHRLNCRRRVGNHPIPPSHLRRRHRAMDFQGRGRGG